MAEADDSLELDAQPSTPSNCPEKSSCASDTTCASERTKSTSSPWHCSNQPHSRIVTDQLEQAALSPSVAPFSYIIQHRNSHSEARHVSPPLSPSLCPHRFALSKLQLHDFGISSNLDGCGTTAIGTTAAIPSNRGHTDMTITDMEPHLYPQSSHVNKRIRHCTSSDEAPSCACGSPNMEVERTTLEPFLAHKSSMLPPVIPAHTTLDSTMNMSSAPPNHIEHSMPHDGTHGHGPQGFDVVPSSIGHHRNQDTAKMLADDDEQKPHFDSPPSSMFRHLRYDNGPASALPTYGACQEKERNSAIGQLRQRRNMMNLRVVVDELAPRAPGALATPSMMTHSPIRIMSSSFSAPASTQGSPLY